MREKRTSLLGAAQFPSEHTEEKTAFLAQTAMFQQLTLQDISELDRNITLLTCPPGRIIFRPGEASTTLFFVKSGNIQIYHLSTDGRKLITATVGEGACFGEQLIYGQQTRTSFAEASTVATLYIMNKTDIDDLLARHPVVACALLPIMEQRLISLENQLLNTTFKSVTARLAILLLQLAEAQAEAQKEQNQPLVVNGLSHEELADHLGVYRETVSTALRELKDAHAIQLGRKHITIRRPELLQNLAQSGSKSELHGRGQG